VEQVSPTCRLYIEKVWWLFIYIATSNLNQMPISFKLRLSATTFSLPSVISVGGFSFGKSEGYYDEPQVKENLKYLILPMVISIKFDICFLKIV